MESGAAWRARRITKVRALRSPQTEQIVISAEIFASDIDEYRAGVVSGSWHRSHHAVQVPRALWRQ